MLKALYVKLKENQVLWVVMGAFLLRLPLIFYSGPMHLPDERLYNKLAKSVLAGTGYAISKGPTLYRPPLYSGFLAALYYVFGPNPIIAALVQAVLSAITCYLIYRITLDLWSKRVALTAAVFWAIGPDMIVFSKLLMTETLFLFLAALLLWLLVSYRGSWALTLGIGVTAGLAALTRPVILPFLPFALAWAVSTGRANAAKVVAAIAICAVVIVPWTIRNYAVTGQFYPIDATGGINLYAGNHYGGKGEWHFPKGNPLADKSLTEVERDRLGYKETWKNIREHPLGTARVIGLKIAYVIFPSGEKLYLIEGTAPPPLLWILLSALFFEGLAVGAAGHLARTEKTPGAGLLWWYIVAGAAVLVAVVFGERYRMAAIYPALVPLAAAGWVYLSEKGPLKRKLMSISVLVLIQIAASIYILAFRPGVVDKIITYFFKA